MHPIILLTSIALLLSQTISAQHFASTCSEHIIEGTGVRSFCKNNSGGTDVTILEMNDCFANQQGTLVYRKGGNAFNSCLQPQNRAVDTRVYAECTDAFGGSHSAEIDLSKLCWRL